MFHLNVFLLAKQIPMQVPNVNNSISIEVDGFLSLPLPSNRLLLMGEEEMNDMNTYRVNTCGITVSNANFNRRQPTDQSNQNNETRAIMKVVCDDCKLCLRFFR